MRTDLDCFRKLKPGSSFASRSSPPTIPSRQGPSVDFGQSPVRWHAIVAFLVQRSSLEWQETPEHCNSVRLALECASL